MDKLEQISFKDKKAIFDRLEKVASQSNLTPEERLRYEEEWKIYNDYFNVIESAEKKNRLEREEACAEAREQGREEGLAEGKRELVRNLKAVGVPIETIIQASGLSSEEIEKL